MSCAAAAGPNTLMLRTIVIRANTIVFGIDFVLVHCCLLLLLGLLWVQFNSQRCRIRSWNAGGFVWRGHGVDTLQGNHWLDELNAVEKAGLEVHALLPQSICPIGEQEAKFQKVGLSNLEANIRVVVCPPVLALPFTLG